MEIPTCIITGRIAGDADACGDCDPCSGASSVPDVVKKLLAEKEEWRQKYAEAMSRLDEQNEPVKPARRPKTPKPLTSEDGEWLCIRCDEYYRDYRCHYCKR